MTGERFSVRALGRRGEGVADGATGPVYLPYALPDEIVTAVVDGDIAHVTGWEVARPDRIAPVCTYFGSCGGCAVQALPAEPYAAWKRGLVVAALARAGVQADVAPLVDAHGAGRRRATFHARPQRSRNVLRPASVEVGFMRARSHDLIDIAACPVLAPALAPALPAAHRLAAETAEVGKPLDIVATASATGLDVDLRGLGPLAPGLLTRLAEIAGELDLARLSNHGEVVVERRAPLLRVGHAAVVLPPGCFLQATEAGEAVLAALVAEAVGGARTVIDLFCGIGTFALRLAERASVRASDVDARSLRALERAAGAAPACRPVKVDARDLAHRPLGLDEVAVADAVVMDPPRAGASAQAEVLARSSVPVVVSVSCSPASFARDAAVLLAGGYELGQVTPVDQFRYSPHVELVGVFRRPRKRATRRPLFG